VTRNVLNGAFPLAVLLRGRRLQHPSSVGARPFELSVHVVDALEDVLIQLKKPRAICAPALAVVYWERSCLAALI